MPDAAAVGRRITISKIRIEDLPPPWSARWETRYFKVVISCAGLRVGETQPKALDATDGCIEWAEPLQNSMRSRNEKLVAIVVSSRHPDRGLWCVLPGCRFEGFGVMHSVWRQSSANPGAGPRVRGEMETVSEGDSAQKPADHEELFVKGDTRQGAGEHMQTFMEGDRNEGVYEHVETRSERGRSRGAGWLLKRLLREGKHQQPAEDAEMGVEVGGRERAAEQLEALFARNSRRGTTGSPETFVEEDVSQGVAEKVKPFIAEKPSVRTAEPPPALRPETHGEIQFHPVFAIGSGTGTRRTKIFIKLDYDSATRTTSTVEDHSGLDGLQASTTSIAQGRKPTFARSARSRQSDLASVRASPLRLKGSDVSAIGRENHVSNDISTWSSAGVVDHGLPKSSYMSSFSGQKMHNMKTQGILGEMATQAARGDLRCTSSEDLSSPDSGTLDYSVPDLTVAQGLVSLFSSDLYSARKTPRIPYWRKSNTRETGTWGMPACDFQTEADELAAVRGIWPKGAPTRAKLDVQPKGYSYRSAKTSWSVADGGRDEGSVAPPWMTDVHISKPAHSASGERARHSVNTSLPTASLMTATRIFAPVPSYEEATRIESEEAPSPRSDTALLPGIDISLRSPAKSSFRALPEVELQETSLNVPQSPSTIDFYSPPPSYESMVMETPLHGHEDISLACAQAHVNDETPERKCRFLRDGKHDGSDFSSVNSVSSVNSARKFRSNKKSMTLKEHTTCVPALVLNPSDELSFLAERLMTPGKPSSLEIMKQPASVSRVEVVARPPSPGAVDTTPRPPTRVAQPSQTSATIEHADPVYVTCFSPRSVHMGGEFQLRVSASLFRFPDYLSRALSREQEKDGAIEADVPVAVRIERGKRATVKLEIPETAFKTLEPDSGGVDEAAGKHPSSVRDIVWNGVRQDAIFHLLCLPGAAPETVDCGVCITEGIRSWRLSFRIEVEPEKLTTETSVVGNRGAKNEVESTSEELGAGRAEGGVSEPTISGTERQETRSGAEEEKAAPRVPPRPLVVCPPAPTLLASRVDPGQSAHESKEHGFRLTVQDGSLHSSIGPITIQEFAQVVRCESDGHEYLVKTVVDCQPSGVKFPDKPLLMDFLVEDASSANASETPQVLVRKGDAGRWRTVKSELRTDHWGTYLRTEVSHFCRFTWGTRNNPSDPARLESSDKKGMIEVQNATDDEVYFVLVPVSFDSDKTSRVTYTGNIGFGVPGVSLRATGGSAFESEEKSHMLPAGFTPDDISVAAGGKFQFSPPPGSSQGKLLVATITEGSQAGLCARVVVLHGKFNTPQGKRRVILPICLKSKSSISARLGPNDIPVNMVMIMAGMGSTTTSSTEALSPLSSTPSMAPRSTVATATVPYRPAQRRDTSTRSCPIS